MVERYFALHTLACQHGGLVTTGENPLDFRQYSLFKFGDADAITAFATQLSQALLSKKLGWFECMPPGSLRLASAAYHQVPTAAALLTQELLGLLNPALAQQNLGTARPLRLHRQPLYAGEYERLDAAYREQLMKSCKVWPEEALLTGQHLLVVDDIRVTGAHERRLQQVLQHQGLASVSFIYLAVLDEAPGLDAHVEHQLNTWEVNSLAKLEALMHSPHFKLNARVCKRLLRWASPMELHALLVRLPAALLEQLQAAILQEGYAALPAYGASLQVIAKVQATRHYQLA